jgi:hypothetical protein
LEFYINLAPVANATVDQIFGTINMDFTFNAINSYDPDGTIVNYTWDFGDGVIVYDTSSIITYSFSQPSTYNVQLTVKDDMGLTDKLDKPIQITVIKANNPPGNVEIISNLVEKGHKNIDYTFEITADDPDENDTIRFVIDWGDGKEKTISAFMNTTDKFTIDYSWDTYGIYKISVYAEDNNNSVSNTRTINAYIDVYPINDIIIGYLIDTDSNDEYEMFHNDNTGKNINVEKHNETAYLIDYDDDGDWDYIFDLENNVLKAYQSDDEGIQGDYSMIIIGFLVILVLIILLLLIYRKDTDEKDESEKEELDEDIPDETSEEEKEEPKKEEKKKPGRKKSTGTKTQKKSSTQKPKKTTKKTPAKKTTTKKSTAKKTTPKKTKK